VIDDSERAHNFLSAGGSPSSKSRRQPLVSESGDFKLLELDNAAYAMDQVLPLPLSTAKTIRTLFYPPNVVLSTERVQGVGPHTLPTLFC
jgi:hypothetical protein